jgi:hypothetical protein
MYRGRYGVVMIVLTQKGVNLWWIPFLRLSIQCNYPPISK